MSNTDPTSPFAPPSPGQAMGVPPTEMGAIPGQTIFLINGREVNINATALDALAESFSRKGAAVGYDGIDFDPSILPEVESLAQAANEVVIPKYEDPEWEEYVSIIDDGRVKGVLMSGGYHPGTLVQTFVVQAPEGTAVQKTRIPRLTSDGKDTSIPGVLVPPHIFRLIENVQCLVTVGNFLQRSERLKGVNPNNYGHAIKGLLTILREEDRQERAREIW